MPVYFDTIGNGYMEEILNLQHIVHYSLHIFLPLVVALMFFRSRWKKAYIIMLLTMAVDLDHLFADPVYAAQRCSIGYHPLHTYGAILLYGALLSFRQTRLIGLGLLLHMFTDVLDCIWMYAECGHCVKMQPELKRWLMINS